MVSERLKRVAKYLENPINFADIGSDHAYLPCYVCLENNQAKAIAGEKNEGPFLRAKQTVKELQLTEQIDVRKGNGLDVIGTGEVKQITIAGMGGKLIRTILTEGKWKLEGVKRLILQPNIDEPLLRRWLMDNHFQLIAEELIEEDGYTYEILIADVSSEKMLLTEKELLFGKYLPEKPSNIFHRKWQREKEKRYQLIEQMEKANQIPTEKIIQLEKEINLIKEVLEK